MDLDLKRLLKPAKKVRKLVDKIDNRPSPDNVHDMRTQIRRLKATFEALSLDAQRIGRSTAKDLGRLRKQAGKVRDMDVLTGYASSIHLKGEEECGVKLLEHIVSKRRKQARKLYADLKRFRPGLRKDLKRAASVLEKLFRNTGRNGAPGIDAVAANAALKIAAQLAAPRRLNRGNLHEYRLKVKELQDVLLVANGSSRPALVDDLGEVKDAIGEWHDWEELVSIAQKVLAHKNRCALQAELKRIAKDKYAQALALVGALRQRDLGEARASAKGASAVRRIRRKPAAV